MQPHAIKYQIRGYYVKTGRHVGTPKVVGLARVEIEFRQSFDVRYSTPESLTIQIHPFNLKFTQHLNLYEVLLL